MMIGTAVAADECDAVISSAIRSLHSPMNQTSWLYCESVTSMMFPSQRTSQARTRLSIVTLSITPAAAGRVLAGDEHQDFLVRTPQELRATDGQDTVATEHEYEGESLIAVDFGRTHADLTVDIVGDTAIVITDSPLHGFKISSDESGSWH